MFCAVILQTRTLECQKLDTLIDSFLFIKRALYFVSTRRRTLESDLYLKLSKELIFSLTFN